MLILCNSSYQNEFDYQALDYCRLFSAHLERDAVNDKSEKYLGVFKTASLSEAMNTPILAFRSLSAADLKQIDPSNRVFYFTTGDIHASALLFSSAINSYVAFGSRSAYKIANSLKAANIDKPVRKIIPWVTIDGINRYESPPIGKLSSAEDMGLRSMLRLMASGAVVVAPNISPFSDIIINQWNGILISGEITQEKLINVGHIINRDQATAIATRAREMVELLMHRQSYINAFTDSIINGNGFDHNEPWIKISVKHGTSWIIIKQTMEEGNLAQIPTRYREGFNHLKPLDIEQLLDYLTPMRFKEVYVFDALIEDVDEAKKNRILRLLSILGDRSKNIFFCLDSIPPQWKTIAHRLIFIPPAEGVKKVT